MIVSDRQSVGRLYVSRWPEEIRVVDIALLPDFCNRGIGTTLLQRLQAEAQASGKPLRIHGGQASTYFRVTLIFVDSKQNITLSVSRALLRRVKRVAADRDTSVSALMAEALGRLADEDRRYSAARKRARAALESPRSLGTDGRRAWSRDELHER